MQFDPYRRNPYRSKAIHNFCNLESHGRIQRGESMYVVITGDLTPFANTYHCRVSKFADMNFNVSNPE
jgi:hypothetical protein